jgi:hypothetical protein
MDDRDVVERLRRIRAGAQAPEPAYERLLTRRDRRRRNSRLTSGVMAFVVFGIAIAAAAMVFTGHSALTHRAPLFGSGDSPPGLIAAPGQYYFTKTQIYLNQSAASTEGNAGVEGPWTVEIWFGPDASGRARFIDATSPAAKSVDYGWGRAPDATYGPGEMPWGDLSGLSSDPDTLYDQLLQRSMPGGASPNPIPTSSPGRSTQESAILRTIADLFNLDEQYTSPSVRAAMFEVSRGLDGVQTLSDVADPVGRPAVALRWVISYEGPPVYINWFFDPSTEQLMAETATQNGQVIEARIVAEAGIADSTDVTPGASHDFFRVAERRPAFLP